MINVEERHRSINGRLVFSFIGACLLFRFLQHATTLHLLQPPLFLFSLDFTYWLFVFLKLPDYIIYKQAGPVLFDVCLFVFCILSAVFSNRRLFAVIFSLLFFIYVITYNTFIVHHAHPLSIMMLITIPFWFKKNLWKLMWQGMRYYICYIYAMSFLWKVWLSKSFFNWNQGIASVKLNLAEYLYHNPTGVTASTLKFFIAHPILLNAGNTFIFLLEGFMVTGFFTKKYDKILMVLPVIIHLCTYLFADVYFIEMLVLIFAFLTKQQTESIGRRFPLILKAVNYG